MNQIQFNSKTIAKVMTLGIGMLSAPMNVEALPSNSTKPNFIVIFTDDMGYGDIGVFGHPSIKTPHLDNMAIEGQKWTSFYVSAPVCTPSRAGLLTGRLAIRSGMTSDRRRVLFPDSNGGLPQSELTIAKILQENGYRTAAIGKWHLGHFSPHLPTDHGFESYFGIPYSNDMDRVPGSGAGAGNYIDAHIQLAEDEDISAYQVPILRNSEIIERPADQRTITKRFTEEAVQKIKEYKEEPFFIYLAHSMPHIPLFRSPEFKDVSLAGFYGDVIEEIDWSVGEIINTLKAEGLDENTLVIFTSDNGPWHTFKTHGGSAGMLRGAKGGTFEGGMRVPTIMRWPGKLQNGTVMDMATTLDLLPTLCTLSGSKIPNDRQLDGYDFSPLLLGTGKSARDVVFFYRDTEPFAVRMGDYKAHFVTQNEYGTQTAHFITNPPSIINNDPTLLETPLLYNVNVDPAERFDIAENHPEIIEAIRKVMEEHKRGIIPVENQLER